ncbi:MAG: hypothetical protein HFG80_04145 [Eubacterium sp.]|jgi:Regulator of polyketide synthase expression|nr:hypothetical protein [Eubacterium sp.]
MNVKPDLLTIQNICIQAILSHWPETDFIHEIYQCMPLSTIVFDETLSLICHAFSPSFHFNDWEEIVKHGAAPQRQIIDNHLIYQEIIYANGGPTFIDWGTCEGQPQTCCPITHKHTLYGYIGIAFEKSSYIQEVMNAQRIIADTLGVLLSRKNPMQSGSLNFDPALLLLSDSLDTKFAEIYLHKHNAPYAMSILHFPKPHPAEILYTLGNIRKSNPFVTSCISPDEENYIYLLFSDLSDPDITEKNFTMLFRMALQQNFAYSISDRFPDIYTLPSHRLQAFCALEVGRKLNPEQIFFDFRQSYPSVRDYYFTEQYGYTASIPAAIRLLMNYDAEHSLNYCETLYRYYENFMTVSETAKILNIHPNTVRLRLNKINELLNLDVEKYETAHQLYSGLQLIYTQQKLLSGTKGENL